MRSVRIYTLRACPFCVRAKDILDSKGCSYTEIDVTTDPHEREAIRRRSGHTTFPQIYIGEDFVGGYDELYLLERVGRLDAILF